MKHKHYLSLRFLTLALVLILAAPLTLAKAQGSISLASLTIRVWPEYDQPTALVFYVGKVAEGTPLPVDLHFQMPPGATLNATAYVDDQTGGLLTATSRVEGSIVTITSPNGSFHVEFYDSGLKVQGSQRTYSLVWQGDYPVGQLALEVEQPAGARDMTVEPAGGSWTVDSNNLQMYTASQSGLQAGQPVTLSMSYAKSDNTLTVDTMPRASSGGTTQTASAPASITWQTIGLGVLAAVLLIAIIGAVVYSFRKRKGTSRASTGAGNRFCPSCGQAAGLGDRFCRRCGASLD